MNKDDYYDPSLNRLTSLLTRMNDSGSLLLAYLLLRMEQLSGESGFNSLIEISVEIYSPPDMIFES